MSVPNQFETKRAELLVVLDALVVFDALRDGWQPPPIQFGPMEVWVMIGQLQLALRHPGNLGPSAAIARSIADSLIELLPFDDVRAAARLGFEERYDL